MTYIPKITPASQIWVVDLALRVDMLTRTDHHGLRWRDIRQRCLPRIRMRHPYRDGEPICGASEEGRDRARQMD